MELRSDKEWVAWVACTIMTKMPEALLCDIESLSAPRFPPRFRLVPVQGNQIIVEHYVVIDLSKDLNHQIRRRPKMEACSLLLACV
jgi:hypothetical protein